jgi:2-polyprenyl-6-hydroxyphenyl methylase/3-demethylubiquinone-9 3-methyltransferase
MQTHQKFVAYYEAQSLAPATLQRFQAQMQRIKALMSARDDRPLRVLDLGCAAGANAAIWAEAGHEVIGIDISRELIELARARVAGRGLSARFLVGSAESVPVADGWADVCLAPELLEHVPDWQRCLDEVTRVLRPGGAVFLSTTNTLCPSQQEYNLPLFSWYPGALKRRLTALTLSRRPDLANYAPYPAVNWFNFYSLRAALRTRHYSQVCGQFDLPLAHWSGRKRLIARAIARYGWARLMSCVALPGTQVYALKSAEG